MFEKVIRSFLIVSLLILAVGNFVIFVDRPKLIGAGRKLVSIWQFLE
jgi:hypothetical protein